jgi:hypothetical protein
MRSYLRQTPQPLYRLEGALLSEGETEHAREEQTLIPPPAVRHTAVGYVNL